MKISSCQIDEAQEQQGSIDGTDVQSANRRGHFCAWHSHWQWSRSSFGCRLLSRHSFCWRQCRRDFVQADDHVRGHPRVLHWHMCRSNIQLLACHFPYGCTRPNLSEARSVGESLSDIAIFSMRTCRDTCAGWGHEYMHRHEHSCTHFPLAAIGLKVS